MNEIQLNLKVEELARDIAYGPSLFDDRGRPTEAVERYNGARLTRDGERCVTVAALKLLAYSDRQIAKVIGCDTRSIPLMVVEAEARGLIPALKERLIVLVGRAAEQSTVAVQQLIDETLDGARSIDHAATLKAIGQVNTFLLDKNQLLTGAATERIEVRVGAGRDEVEAWALANAIPIQADARPNDTQSAGNLPVALETRSLPPMRHDGDTDLPAEPPARDQDGSAPGPSGGGGGVAFSGGGAEMKMDQRGAKF
jgi:hypothetical protein